MSERDNAYRLYTKAETLVAIRRFEEAKRLALQAISDSPEWEYGYVMHARACFALSEFESAKESLVIALRIAPDNAWCHMTMATCLRLQRKLDLGVYHAEEALRLQPCDANSHIVYGQVLSVLGKDQAAAEAFVAALAHDPDNHRALKYLAETYLGRGYVSEAEKFYRRALEIEPNDPVCLNNLGVCLLRAGRKLDSAIAFKAAILADPTMALAKSNTKNVLSNFLGLGASGIVLIQVLLVSLLWGGHFYLSPATAEEDSSAPAFLAVSLAVTVIAFIGIRFWKHRRLRSADPQIMDIYRRLRKDREVK